MILNDSEYIDRWLDTDGDDYFDIASLITISIDKLGVSVTCFAKSVQELTRTTEDSMVENAVVTRYNLLFTQ